jgi:hypothetical protein
MRESFSGLENFGDIEDEASQSPLTKRESNTKKNKKALGFNKSRKKHVSREH